MKSAEVIEHLSIVSENSNADMALVRCLYVKKGMNQPLFHLLEEALSHVVIKGIWKHFSATL